jgi:transposase-like protein
MATRAFELRRRRDPDNSRAARAKELSTLTISAVTDTSVPTDETSPQHATPVATPRPRAKRRNLTEAEKADIGRLYAETTTPLSEIKSRFGIAESSLYRLLQQRGITLRGRGARTEPAPARAETRVTRRQGRPARGAGPVRRQATRRVSGLATYRVSFVGVQVVEAVDILDAIRQAHKLGATEVMQVERAAALV